MNGDWTGDFPDEWPDEGLDTTAPEPVDLSDDDHGSPEGPEAGFGAERGETDPSGLGTPEAWDATDPGLDPGTGLDPDVELGLDLDLDLGDGDQSDHGLGFLIEGFGATPADGPDPGVDLIIEETIDVGDGSEPDDLGSADEWSTDGPDRVSDPWLRWSGNGLVDPAGATGPSVAAGDWFLEVGFDADASGSDARAWIEASDADPTDWIRLELFGPEDGPSAALDVDLLDASAMPSATTWWGGSPVSRGESLDRLWDRLAPGESMPAAPDGGPDRERALSLLAERSSSPAAQDVIEALRRLLAP